MAGFEFFKLVYVLLLSISTSRNVVGSAPFRNEYHLEDPVICNENDKKFVIKLPNIPNSAVNVSSQYTFTYPYVYNKRCQFIIKAPKHRYLMAVIQSMSLRKNDNEECLDYIQFKRKDKHDTEKFCGELVRQKWLQQPSDSTIQTRHGFAEFDLEGEIETTIFVSNIPMERGQKLGISILYTSYRDCRSIKDGFQEFKSIANTSLCMWRGYYCDGLQNCDYEVCQDEDNCEKYYDESTNTGTKVTIGAVTTMLLCFIIFTMGLWICRKYKKLCWSSDCAGPNVHESRLSRNQRETASSAHQSVAVDPMLEVAVLPSALDKDLPPSYDSLFPERPNPSTT